MLKMESNDYLIICRCCNSMVAQKNQQGISSPNFNYRVIQMMPKVEDNVQDQHEGLLEDEKLVLAQDKSKNKPKIYQILSYAMCGFCRRFIGFRRQDMSIETNEEIRLIFFFKKRKIRFEVDEKSESLISPDPETDPQYQFLQDLGYLCETKTSMIIINNIINLTWSNWTKNNKKIKKCLETTREVKYWSSVLGKLTSNPNFSKNFKKMLKDD